MDRSILVVDDEENFLLLLDRVLGKQGFTICSATNAYRALNFLDQQEFSFAIVDVKMFPVDGLSLLSEIKKRSPSTRVIMITAHPTADGRDKCLQIGASNYLTKPLDIGSLQTLLENLAAS
jgi:DNA-binding NtrC family response regulator